MKNFFNPYSLLAIYILIIVNFNIINACYITNCPWGGKRSQPIESLLENPRQCRKCASGLGTCFGPRICCGPDIGCLIDSKETNVCKFEDVNSREPCMPYGKQCEKVEYGRCATSNLCCNPDHCLEDLSCNYDEDLQQDEGANIYYDDDEKELDMKLIKALNKLIAKKKQSNLENSSKKNKDSYRPKYENDK
ncbi:unnamed protein product [Brachionus calyciflorus]|uniref:Uncharacterized protein n=1 Tax=Brachionus calyciflorus TaxID=104777 RepID=A0A813M5M5_9BILA|nr:unnamed protein product [Brachionus calyciflorus]